MKIIVTAGGTGGHIYPALAIIDYFKTHEKKLDVLYIGTHNRMEKDIIPSKNIKYVSLEIYGLSKTKMIRNVKNLFLISKGIKKCKKIMQDFKPDVVIGVGGYVTYPVIKAAKSLKIPVFLHEQNSLPGKTNIALSKGADLVGLTFEESRKYFKDAKKVVYTGHPCGESALHIKPAKKEELNISKDQKIVTVVGGSLGSASINKAMKTYLMQMKNKKYTVVYITGQDHYEDFVKDTNFPSNVKVLNYYDPLTALMRISDVLVTRAGAATVSEFLTLKLPAIVIPSPYVANNHQYYNALEIKNAGACEMIEEKDLTVDTITKAIEDLLNNKDKVFAMKKAQEGFKAEKSSEIIYDEIKEVLR